MERNPFKSARGKFATGVTVITTRVDNDIRGMTANAFMFVSKDPMLVVISLDNNTAMLDKINESGKFTVNILSNEQKKVAMHFAGQKKLDVDIEFDIMNKLPVIKNALSSVVCDVDRTLVAGDHTLCIGKVVDLSIGEGEPLTYYRGKYGSHQSVEYTQQQLFDRFLIH